MKATRFTISLAGVMCLLFCNLSNAHSEGAIRLRTVLGDIFVTLTPDAAPQTVANFKEYLSNGDFEETFFHQSLPGGEGEVQTLAAGKYRWSQEASGGIADVRVGQAIPNEFNQSNRRGTIAMVVPAGQPDGATNAWFINVADNSGTSPDGLDFLDGGATVFGTINAAGMEVVDAISAQCTDDRGGDFLNLPTLPDGAVEGTREELILITETREFTSVTSPVSALLPSSRSIRVDSVASAFATIINTSSEIAASCRIKPVTDVPAVFEYFQTDPGTNQPVGEANPEIDIPANGFATLAFTFTPLNSFPSTEIEFEFSCGNAEAPAVPILGVNTFLLAANGLPGADVVAISATAGSNGIVDIPAGQDAGAFVVATTNVGDTEAITVTADTGDVTLPLNLFVCETNPITGACLSPPAPSSMSTLDANATATFAVFALLTLGGSDIAFDPAVNRVFVRFRNTLGDLRGSTSVAIRTVSGR